VLCLAYRGRDWWSKDLCGRLHPHDPSDPRSVTGRTRLFIHGDYPFQVVDLLGRPIRLFSGSTFAGTDNIVEWDLKGVDGAAVAPGVYLARVTVEGPAGRTESTLKLAVLR